MPKTFASTRRREHEVWVQMGGEVTQLSWRKCQKVVLANGSAKSGASLGQVAVSLANRRALV
jgi:hypothetical protein